MSLTFLPWLRAGLARHIHAADGTSALRNRATVPVGVTLNTRAVPVQQVELLGPGDVIGFDARQVVRTDPPDSTPAHEVTHFVSVELDSPHLPWQFTPAAATQQQRLRPWMCLAVVRMTEGVSLAPGRRPGSTVLHIRAPASVAAELPDLAQAWAWAHVQLAGTVTSEDLADVLTDRPERSLSRLLCPRPLVPDTPYAACVVPTFAAGRDAGLGEPVDPTAALAPAWVSSNSEARLPVYYAWRFSTGEAGDFASLAAALRPRGVPSGAGSQRLALGALAPGAAPLPMAGALRVPGLDQGAGPPPQVGATLAAATTADTAASDLPLPLYGGSYAAATAVDPHATGWLAELNLDPRRRVAAALGAQVIRERQEDLVAAAWTQAGAADRANSLLNRARLGREVADRLRARHLEPLTPEVLAQVTAPAHTRLRASPHTVRAAITRSVLPDAAVSAVFRRLTRPRGPVMRRALAGQAPRSLLPTGPEDRSPAALTWQVSGLPAAPRERALRAVEVIQAPLDARFKAAVLEQLDAERTVPERVLARLRVEDAARRAKAVATSAGETQAAATDPLGGVLVAPRFATPMFGDLAASAPEHILPGAGRLPANCVVVLQTDAAFVAAFLAGLNHELQRELVWRGFPLDRRATFFRQFWDFRGQGRGAPDIGPLADWSPDQSLAAQLAGSEERLVLAVRGDLLRRYPRTLVYAVRAERTATGVQPADEASAGATVEPGFSGFLPIDLRFFGFPLRAEEVRSRPAHPGWFFVFQEPPTEARFGPPDGGSLPLVGSAADVARAALRPRLRVAIHADDLVGFT